MALSLLLFLPRSRSIFCLVLDGQLTKKLLVISLTLTQMEMSGLFLAATGDSWQWPACALGFLNIRLEERRRLWLLACACMCECVNRGLCGCLTERERQRRGKKKKKTAKKQKLPGRCQHRHHDPSHLGSANWQLISRIESVVRSQVPAPLPAKFI